MKHNHYFKDCPYEQVDVYRIIEIFGVTDPCIQHALKKLLCSGVRGHKDQEKDIQDVIDTLERWKQMRNEDAEITSNEVISPKVSAVNADIDSPVEKWYPGDSGEWIEYDGSGQPVDDDIEVEVLLAEERERRRYDTVQQLPKYWYWDKDINHPGIVVVAYKVVK